MATELSSTQSLQQQQAAKGVYLKPTAEQVLEAAESLYLDELRPFGRILLKRIRERIAATLTQETGVLVDVEEVPLIDPKYLRKVLMSRGLAFLKNRSLGEVCHIVQLAISQKKILGYADGKLVPYSRSEAQGCRGRRQECTKERCAVRQQPVAAAADELPFASWEDLRRGLHEILLTSCNPAPGSVTLSNVKRLFRAQLNLELSETVLGHSRVWELLQDPRLQDVCVVEAFGNGQAVVKAVEVMPHFASHFQAMAMQSAFFSAMPSPGLCCPSTCASNRAVMPAPAPQLPLPQRLGTRGAPLLSVPPPQPQPQKPRQLPLAPFDLKAGPPGQLGLPLSKAAIQRPPPAQLLEDGSSTRPPSSVPSAAGSAACGPKAGSAGSLGATETASFFSHEDLETSSIISGLGRQADPDLSVLSKVRQVLASQAEAEESDCDQAGKEYIVKNTFIEMSPACSGSSSRRTRSVPRSFWLEV